MIHDEHPFATPESERDPVRRFRGRLSAPVTIVTAGPPEARTGLTVSSMMVADEDPGRVYFLCGLGNDLWPAIEAAGTFVVHVLEQDHRQLSDRFAGIRPSPGGLFSGLDVDDGAFGPVLTELGTRAGCRLSGSERAETYVVVEGRIEDVSLNDLSRPLQWFRGRYRE